MTRRPVSNLLGLVVLSYLTQGPMHPYELSRTMRAHGDDRSVKFTHGSVYMAVQQLERAGFVRQGGTARDGQRPERTLYELTPAGRVELRDWMRELVGEPRHEYPQYVAALSLISALPPDDVVGLLRARLRGLAVLRGEAQEIREQALGQGVHPLFLIEEAYRIAQLDTDAAFTQQFIDQIRSPDGGWGPEWQRRHDAFLEGRGGAGEGDQISDDDNQDRQTLQKGPDQGELT